MEVALEHGQEHLLRAGISLVDPVERAKTLSIGAGRHVGGDVKVGEALPDASVLDGKDSEIVGLNRIGIVVVRDSESTSAEIIDAIGMILAHRVTRADVISVRGGLNTDGSSTGGVPGSSALIACDLSGLGAANRELEDVFRVGGVVLKAMEPPLIERAVHEGHDGTVVAWRARVGGGRYIEPPHAGMEEGSMCGDCWSESGRERYKRGNLHREHFLRWNESGGWGAGI